MIASILALIFFFAAFCFAFARVDTVEKAQEDMSSQLKVMSDEIKELRDQLKSKDGQARGELSQTQPSSQPSNAPSGPGRVSEPIQTCTVNGSDQSELLEIISLGRRTVGLHKIDRADLERMRQEQYGGAKTEEQERLLAVQEYLRCELKIGDRKNLSSPCWRTKSPVCHLQT